MKIVLNKCHGGFSLSPTAVNRYAAITGRTIYPHTAGWGQFYTLGPRPRLRRMGLDETSRGMIPLSIRVVEELGPAAFGLAAELVILYIPAGTAYRIKEYDGLEFLEFADDIEWQIGQIAVRLVWLCHNLTQPYPPNPIWGARGRADEDATNPTQNKALTHLQLFMQRPIA